MYLPALPALAISRPFTALNRNDHNGTPVHQPCLDRGRFLDRRRVLKQNSVGKEHAKSDRYLEADVIQNA
jgi:hypothetical protein